MKREDTAGTRVWLLTGEEFQRLERMKEILDATVDKATKDFNCDILTPESFKPDSFPDIVMTFPMMAERRVIVLRDFDSLHPEFRKKAAATLADTPDTTLVILEGEKISPKPKPPGGTLQTEHFKPIYEQKLPPWIQQRFALRGKRVRRDAIALLINNVGIVLRELDSEIEKISVSVDNRGEVTADDVERIVGAFRRDTVYNLANAVGLGDLDDAARILTALLDSEKNRESYYIGSLATHIVKAADYNNQVRRGVPREEAMKAAATSAWFWKLNRMDEQTRRLSPKAVRYMLTLLADLDSRMKRYAPDKGLMLEIALPLMAGKRKT